MCYIRKEPKIPLNIIFITKNKKRGIIKCEKTDGKKRRSMGDEGGERVDTRLCVNMQASRPVPPRYLAPQVFFVVLVNALRPPT